MSESIILKGAILSAASIGVGGIVIAAMIMDYRFDFFNILLPLISVLVVAGIVMIMYGTSKINKETSE